MADVHDWECPETMAAAERRAVITALENCGGSASGAAARLRIGRSTINRMIKRLEVDRNALAHSQIAKSCERLPVRWTRG